MSLLSLLGFAIIPCPAHAATARGPAGSLVPPAPARGATGASMLPAAARGAATALMLPPVEPACVSSPFGPRIMPNRPLAGTFHYGIDLPAPLGSPVTAVAPGSVIRVQHHGIGGLEMLIQHNGFIGVYSHLGLIAPVIAEGRATIYGGQRIATVGHTGLTYGPHLYFGMIVNGQSVDPAPYMKVTPCGSAPTVSRDPRIPPTRLFARY